MERAFVRQIHLGETLLPFRLLAPLEAVLPVTTAGILESEAIEEQPGLATWWNSAEKAWSQNKVDSDPSDLLDRIDFHAQLSAQLPSGAHRVMYTKAGNRIAAARLNEAGPIIDHKLYWCAVSSAAEARYLTSILNSETLLDRVRPLQALGLFGTRDFDKTVFYVPIPSYDGNNMIHRRLVDHAKKAEELAAGLDLSDVGDFKRARSAVRMALAESGIAGAIEASVASVLPEIE